MFTISRHPVFHSVLSDFWLVWVCSLVALSVLARWSWALFCFVVRSCRARIRIRLCVTRRVSALSHFRLWSVTFLVDALCRVRSVVKHKFSCAVCRLNLCFIYVLSVSCLTDAVLGLWAKRRFKVSKSQKCRLEFVCQALCCLPSLA